MIGYSEFRTNLPGGLTANRYTTRAYLVNPDGAGRCEVAGKLTEKPDTWTQFAGWSPDGTIAIIGCGWESPENAAWEEEHREFRLTEGYLYDMYLLNMVTGELANVTAVERVSNYNAGLWFWPGSPGKLGFNPIINGIARPFSMDLDGRNKRDLSEGTEGFTYGYTASPDGTKISYHKNYRVYMANADGSESKLMETGNPFNFAPQWSPDGKWLLFVSGEHYNCHPHIVGSDSKGLREVGNRQGYSGVVPTIDVYNFHGGSSDVPVWSRDGRWIYYTAKVGESIEMMRADLDGYMEQLTHSAPDTLNYHPTPSPDGEHLIIGSTRSGTRQLYIMKEDGSDIYPFTSVEPGYAAMHPHWQP
jgi:TolB protein